MFTAYQVNGETKYWQTKSSAMRKARDLNFENETELWTWGWEHDKGWFLEDLWSDYQGEINLDELIAQIRNA
jgi:hypothetical protein